MSSNISPSFNNSDIDVEEPITIEPALGPSLNNSDVELEEHAEEHAEKHAERAEEHAEEPDTIECVPKPTKRGLPKTILANQQKYLEALEKQKRMLKKPKSTKEKVTKQEEKKDQEKRRINVAGRIKYINVNNNIPVFKNTTESIETSIHPTEKEVRPVPEKLPKPETHKPILNKETSAVKTSQGSKCSRKIPSKYAKKVEEEVKQQTIKNVKNFSDLRRIRVMQTIVPDCEMDTTRASIAELRKLKVAQRKKELAELKIKSEANKKESAVQEILNNSNMSKFAKTVAIKNLSASSRHRNVNEQTPFAHLR